MKKFISVKDSGITILGFYPEESKKVNDLYSTTCFVINENNDLEDVEVFGKVDGVWEFIEIQ